MRRRVIAAIAALTATLLLLTAVRAHSHPLHTTLTDVVVTSGSVRATVRLFADDLAAAMGERSADAEIASYVAARLVILDDGRAVARRGCGVKRTSDLLWVCIEGSLAGSAAKLSVQNALLTEAFKDQINIVQATRGTEKRSFVFTRGDGPKRLLP
jgi:hypothetical protein